MFPFIQMQNVNAITVFQDRIQINAIVLGYHSNSNVLVNATVNAFELHYYCSFKCFLFILKLCCIWNKNKVCRNAS